MIILAEWVAIAVATAQSVAEGGPATASPPQSASAAAGRASCTTSRCRASPACASCSPRQDAATPGALDRLLELGIEQVDLTIAEMRRLIADLRPTSARRAGAGRGDRDAQRTPCPRRRDRRRDGRRPRLPDGYPGQRLVPEIEDTAYRLVQEALNNAARHGGAKHARVEVSEQGETLRIRVSDDGRGFDPGARSDGYGLGLAMRERIALAGGLLELRSAPGDGTTIVALLPARHRAEGDGEASGSSHSSPAEPEKEPAGGS